MNDQGNTKLLRVFTDAGTNISKFCQNDINVVSAEEGTERILYACRGIAIFFHMPMIKKLRHQTSQLFQSWPRGKKIQDVSSIERKTWVIAVKHNLVAGKIIFVCVDKASSVVRAVWKTANNAEFTQVLN